MDCAIENGGKFVPYRYGRMVTHAKPAMLDGFIYNFRRYILPNKNTCLCAARQPATATYIQPIKFPSKQKRQRNSSNDDWPESIVSIAGFSHKNLEIINK